MNLSCLQPLSKPPNYLVPAASTFPASFHLLRNHTASVPSKSSEDSRSYKYGKLVKREGGIVRGWLLPVDPWAPNIDSQSIASQLFAVSLFPYIGFLYFITKSKSAPKLTLFGFYFLLAFVGATIPAGIYAKVKYGTSLSNVDWLHGGAESLLTHVKLHSRHGKAEETLSVDEVRFNFTDIIAISLVKRLAVFYLLKGSLECRFFFPVYMDFSLNPGFVNFHDCKEDAVSLKRTFALFMCFA
ncbi:hypothetical protein V6N12_054071 [Hibiscus sabdariffa]|uniref:Uncharacterized protein n=1 Tax=Hibiscus sabdariffa TaxID=183260 RepID=A0ABR2BPG5_9ROSI